MLIALCISARLADAVSGISTSAVSAFASAEHGLLQEFPVITAGGRGLEVVARNRSAASRRPVLPVHEVTTLSLLHSPMETPLL